MRYRRGLKLPPLVLGLALPLMAGCAKMVSVSGTCTLPSTVNVGDKDIVQVQFVPETSGHGGGVAMVSHQDHSFACKLFPGKYKIAVRIEPGPRPGMLGAEGAKHAAELAEFNQTCEPASTRLSYEVTSLSSQSIAIDVDKGDVATK
jgi:hypothetical protein